MEGGKGRFGRGEVPRGLLLCGGWQDIRHMLRRGEFYLPSIAAAYVRRACAQTTPIAAGMGGWPARRVQLGDPSYYTLKADATLG